MCGICGKLIFKDIIPDKGLIKKMCNTLLHRGPDDEGIYVAKNIGLGQRRLSIIDLDSNACAPLSNEDNSIWLVFNGEIYNFYEIRKDLILRNHIFKTHSDTEVIIHAYEEFGYECLQKFRGMFSFALYDNKKKKLFCARDRIGKKPFYYTLTPGSFIFASEIKAITLNPEVSISPNYHAIDQYLTYYSVPSPESAFEGISKLSGGEYLVCDLSGNMAITKYWDPPDPQKTNNNEAEIERNIVLNLKEAVKLRMISDVSLGAFLSGGIDSATIVALMALESEHPVKTFSIGLENDKNSELPYASLIAKKYKTDHHELVVKASAIDVLPLLVKHYNEPFSDSSAIPTYYVSQLASKYVKVALSGDGGDETFAGYDNYSSLIKWSKIDRIPYFLRKKTANAGQKILKFLPANDKNWRYNRGLKMLGASNVKERRLMFGTTVKPEEKDFLYTKKFKDLLSEKNHFVDRWSMYPFLEDMDELDWLMRHDQNCYLPDCLMVKTDVASMANSLEVRSPFLDHKFIEFAAKIPSALKMNNSGRKLILKSAVKDLLPIEILNKPKTGFGIPLNNWFQNELAPLLKEILLGEKARKRGLFNIENLKIIVDQHIIGRRDWSNRLWSLLFLELWFQEFID